MSVTPDNLHLRPILKQKISRKWERKIKVDQQKEREAGPP